MKKIKFPYYVSVLILNYILVLFAVLFYKQGALVVYPIFLLTQPLLVLLNCLVSQKIGYFIFISLNLIVSTIIANIVGVWLYMSNVCGGSETILLLQYAVVIGCIYVTVLSIISFIVKTVILKCIKNNV